MSGRTFTGNQGHPNSSIRPNGGEQLGGQQHAPAYASPNNGARVSQLDLLKNANATVLNNRNVATQSGSKNIYAALGDKNAADWGDVLGAGDLYVEEQARLQALENAAQLGVGLQQLIMRRNTNHPAFQAFKAGIERLRRPSERNPHIVDEVGGRFIDMALGNQSIYAILVSNTIIQVVGLTAQAILNGDQTDRNKRTMSLILDAASTSATYELIEYLAHTPNGLEQYHNLTKQIRDVIVRCEQEHDRVAGIFALSDTVCPWGRTTMKDALARYSQSNPLLDVNNHFTAMVSPDPRANPIDYAMAGYLEMNSAVIGGRPMYENSEQYIAGSSPEQRELLEWNAKQARLYRENNVLGYSSENHTRRQIDNGELQPVYDHNGFDRVIPPFELYTYERRSHYKMSDYFKPVGNTGWSIGKLEDSVRLLTFSYSDQARRNNRLQRDEVLPNSALKILLVKINDDGSVNYRHVKVGREMADSIQEKVWTNPDTVLPFMWEEDGAVKTSWTPRVETTDQRIQEGKVVNLGVMKELDKEPNMVITSKAIVPTTDAQMHSRIEAAMKLYDPKTQLDAFVAPVTLNRQFTLMEGLSSKYLYSSLAMLIKGEKVAAEYDNTIVFLHDVQKSLEAISDGNLVSFIRNQMTMVVNRWLVEVRGYSEQNPNNKTYWVKLDDLFEDLKAFVHEMSEYDPEGLADFLRLTDDHPLLNGWQFLLSADGVKEHLMKSVDESDVEAKLEAEVVMNRSLFFSRDIIMVKLPSEVGPLRDDLIVSMASEDPKLHAIINKALEHGRKYFITEPTVLIDYGSPVSCKLRSVGYSVFDRSCIRLRSISEMQELCLLHPAI